MNEIGASGPHGTLKYTMMCQQQDPYRVKKDGRGTFPSPGRGGGLTVIGCLELMLACEEKLESQEAEISSDTCLAHPRERTLQSVP